MANASESVIEIDQQYVLPEQVDMDIFGKKRFMKDNQDDVYNEVPENSDRLEDSGRYSHASESELTRTNKKLMAIQVASTPRDEPTPRLNQVRNDVARQSAALREDRE